MPNAEVPRWLTGRRVLIAAVIVFFAVLMIWPIVLTTAGGFVEAGADGSNELSLRPIALVFSDPVTRDGLVNSTIIAAAVTALSLAIALPLAVISTAYRFRGKAILSALILVPLILPPFVGAIGMRAVLGRFGAINALLADLGIISPGEPLDMLGSARLIGVIGTEALHLYPIIFLNAAAALANLDPALEQAAENLGASRWTRFRRVTLPLILPGLFAGATIVFIWSFTELGTPLMFDYYTVAPVQIFWGIQEMADSSRPYALVVVTLTVSLMFYAMGKAAFGRRGYAMATRGATARTERPLRGWRGVLAAAPFVIVTLLAVMPHLGVIGVSISEPGAWYRSVLPTSVTGAHFESALGHGVAADSIRNSLVYSSAAMTVDLLVGLALAWLIVRVGGRIGAVLDHLSMLPLAVPGLVLAFGYAAMSIEIGSFFRAFDAQPPPWLSVLGENPNPLLFLIAAYAIRRLPYVVRSAVAGLQQTSGEMEQAAMNLGASPLYATRRIIVPLIAANLVAGGLLAFSFAMLEVSDSLLLAHREQHYPITKAIYILFERIGDGPYIASALGVWGMALLTVTLVGASLMLGKRLGAVFRV